MRVKGPSAGTNFDTMSSPAKDLSHHLSVEAQSRKLSPLKSAFVYYNQPGMTFLGGGLPLLDYFPFDKVTADIPTAPFANGIGAQVSESDKSVVEIHKRADRNRADAHDVELARLLQYGFTEGAPELLQFLRTHTEMVHHPQYSDWDLIALVGNTQLWDAALRTFTLRGDAILVELYLFLLALETAHAQGVTTVAVPMDAEGMLPQLLAAQLDAWVGPKPRLLYTIPTGQNPTGSSLSAERRRQIYALCQQHDIIIIEDEPYYFLQMEPYTEDVDERRKRHVHLHEAFLGAMVPLFLLLDTDGRVIRLDSFSKILAPGLRFGWVVGQKRLLERFVRLHEVLIQCPLGLTQSLTNGVLQRWGQPGYLDWLIGLRAEYTHKRDVAIDAVRQHFPAAVTQFVPPVAGMFFTTEFDALKHPKFALEYQSDPLLVEKAIYERGLEQGCLMIPGSWFKVSGETNPKQPAAPAPLNPNTVFFRGTYAAVPLDALQHGLEKFGRAVKIEFGLE